MLSSILNLITNQSLSPYKIVIAFSMLLFFMNGFISCQNTDIEGPYTLPTNLEVKLESNVNGKVSISFKAKNANFYRVNFGLENGVAGLVEGSSVTNTYYSPGTYTITVQAHRTEEQFISSSVEVVITKESIGTPDFEIPEGYQLFWHDEFEETLSEDWTYDLRDGCPFLCGWGNNELQFYRKENGQIRDGNFVITAKKEKAGNKDYTSARIKTQGKMTFQFGRVDIRAKLPKGQGLWPSFWTLGENYGRIGWPESGEIDIMEMIGGDQNGRDNTVHGTLHWSHNGYHATKGGEIKLANGIFNDGYHVFSIIWTKDRITWLLDGKQYHMMNITPDTMDEFRTPHFLILNLAVGGNWPGSPDASTVFPQEMLIDYVRIFQKK